MKSIFFLIGICLLLLLQANAQNSIVNIKNSTGKVLSYGVETIHGSPALPGTIQKGEIKKLIFNPNVMTGTEGNISILPSGEEYNRVIVYYDNPLIGQPTYSVTSSHYHLQIKPTKWLLLDDGMECVLDVEITDLDYVKGPISVAMSNNGVIRGSILWDKNNITSPEINPYGDAFAFRVMAPTQFIESAGPFTLEKTGSYNNMNGYFQGLKQVGTVTYETVPSFNPNYVEIRYMVSGVPAGVPLELDITTSVDKSKWIAGPQKPKPADDYVFVVGTFAATNKSTVTIDNNMYQLNAIDFTCDGDWFKIDPNGNLTGGGAMVNKIASRKNSPVLPGNGMIAVNSAAQANTMIAAPAVQNKSQNTQVQKVRTVGAGTIKIKQ